jgi:hypothetical protein
MELPSLGDRKDTLSEEEAEAHTDLNFLTTMGTIYSEVARVKYAEAEALMRQAAQLKAEGDIVMARATELLKDLTGIV